MLANLSIGDLSDRVFQGNDQSALVSGDYVLAVLNRALRAEDNPVIDVAIAQANTLNLPLIVYSELDETVAWASDRLFYFVLGAFRELARSLEEKNIQCIQQIQKTDTPDSLKTLDRKSVV